MMPCDAPVADGVCAVLTAKRYGTGPRCPEHTPAAQAGRPETAPDPSLGAEALAQRVPVWRSVPYGTATTDPLGRQGEGWNPKRFGIPVTAPGWKRDPKTGGMTREKVEA